MHKLPEAWSSQETMQAKIMLCEMCRIFLSPTQLQNHSASYKNCPILKQHTQDNFNQKRQKTYADIVTSSYNADTDLQTTQTNSHNETTNQINHLNKLRNTVTNLTNYINNYLHQNNNFITTLIAKTIITTQHMTSPIDIVRQTTQTYMNMAGTQQQNTPNDNTNFTDDVFIHDLVQTPKSRRHKPKER